MSAEAALMVAWRTVWYPLGLNPDGAMVYAPIGDKWMLAFDGKTFHATEATLKVHPRRKTVDTVCGKRARRYGLAADAERILIPVWPSPAKYRSDTDRCRECFEQTGRRRPHAMFKDEEVTA